MKTTDKLLNRICLDERIQDGTFMLENDLHMDILQEYLEKYGITKEESIGIRNKILEGRFPDRQAWNKNGLLVTFPTPAYKQRALQRGTHFEQDPTKKAPNISFQGQPAAPAQAVTPAAPVAPAPAPAELPQTSPKGKEADQTNVPQGQLQPAPMPAPAPPVASNPLPTLPPAGTPPAQAVPETPIAPEKTPEQKKAEEEYTERLLKTEEITLDEGKKIGLKCTLNNLWYDKDGYVVGKTIYNEEKNRQLIRLIKND